MTLRRPAADGGTVREVLTAGLSLGGAGCGGGTAGEIAPVSLEEDGNDVDALEAALAEGPVRLVHVIPNFHNPAGCTLSEAKRRRLVELTVHDVDAWLAATPADFRFAVKAQRGAAPRAFAETPEPGFPFLTDPRKIVRWKGVDATVEASPGGVYRVNVTGAKHAVGEYVEVDAPHRVVFTWDINPYWQVETDPSHASEVEVRFIAQDDEHTRVELEHRNIDRHGPGWEAVAGGVGSEGGWPLYLSRYGALFDEAGASGRELAPPRVGAIPELISDRAHPPPVGQRHPVAAGLVRLRHPGERRAQPSPERGVRDAERTDARA